MDGQRVQQPRWNAIAATERCVYIVGWQGLGVVDLASLVRALEREGKDFVEDSDPCLRHVLRWQNDVGSIRDVQVQGRTVTLLHPGNPPSVSIIQEDES
jgi:hypothetical protein